MKSQFNQMVEEVVAEVLESIDSVLDEIVDDLADVGNPEKLIGKKYADWTPEDIERLRLVYGDGADTPLSRAIANGEYKELRDLQRQVGEKEGV